MHHFRYTAKIFTANPWTSRRSPGCATPTHAYSAATIADNHIEGLAGSPKGLTVRVCHFASWAPNPAVVRHLSNLGSAFDFVSGGELRRVQVAGGSVKQSVFAGVGKADSEIRLALEAGIYSFHVESEPELVRINHVAGKVGVKAPIAIRVNPDVDANTHAKITTGTSANKFGIPLKQAAAAFEAASKYPNITLRGIQTHIGSQITELRRSRRRSIAWRRSRRTWRRGRDHPTSPIAA